MKRLVLLLTVVGTMWFTACGGESSKEAKELLQRILNLVGIPPYIVVNICQDKNDNNLCESIEVLAKITIDTGDTVDVIWEKLFSNGNNSYWLDDIDPDKKLLLVMQDKDSVQHDNGKFILPFSVDETREQNASKELSILESMVDANYLNASEVVAVKSMDSVDKFYDVLLKDLMKNFNTLKAKELDSSQSILANLEYMASDLREKGIDKRLPDSVNACNGNVACVDAIIDDLFRDLEITDAEAEEIARVEKAEESNSGESSNSGVQRSKRTLFLSKETEYGKDGEVERVTTYQYDSSNKLISSSDSHGEECTLSYDTKNRLIEDLCTYTYNGETTTDKFTYQYSGDKLVEYSDYYNGNLESQQWRVTKWNGDKPVTVEWIDNEDGTTNSWNLSYTGDNSTHIDYEHQWAKGTVDKEYDNKETPLDMYSMFGGNYFLLYGQNNVTREETTPSYTYNGQTRTSKKSVTRNEIIYNSHALPTRIDTYETYEGGEDSSHTYTTYEYR